MYASVLALPFNIPADVFWPYCAGITVLLCALPGIFARDLPKAHGLDKILAFGPLFYALPMAAFGAQHFTGARFVARMVPAWVPWHLFWTYFIGTALIAAALSIVTRQQAWLSASLLALLLFLFVVTMHIPTLLSKPYDRIQLAVVFRDLSFSGGALAFAGTQMLLSRARVARGIITVARFFIAVPVLVFSVEQFLHPSFVPAVPLAKLTPAWIPGHLFWTYFGAVVFVVSGGALIINKKARLAATTLGIAVLVLILFVYLPIEIASPADIANAFNYFVDTLAFAGAALLLAAALPREFPATNPMKRLA